MVPRVHAAGGHLHPASDQGQGHIRYSRVHVGDCNIDGPVEEPGFDGVGPEYRCRFRRGRPRRMVLVPTVTRRSMSPSTPRMKYSPASEGLVAASQGFPSSPPRRYSVRARASAAPQTRIAATARFRIGDNRSFTSGLPRLPCMRRFLCRVQLRGTSRFHKKTQYRGGDNPVFPSVHARFGTR